MMTSWEPVVDYLLENMQEQAYKKDGRPLSEHELTQRFEPTRTEARRAYDRLKEISYVYSRQGGDNYYVECLGKMGLVLSSTDSFSVEISPLAGRFSTRLLSCECIAWHKDIHERLTVVRGKPVLCVK